jgi:SulP family sulfate permease
MGRMPYMDQSGLYAMEDVLIDLVKQDKKVLLVNVLKQPKHMLSCIDIIPELIPTEQLFETMEDCLGWLKENENA